VKTAIMVNRSVFMAGATAALALAALSFAGSAKARDDVYWSVGMGAPGVSLNVGNAGPVYMQAPPVYYQAAPVYYQPRPVLVRPAPIYYQPQAVYYDRPYRSHRRHGGSYVQAPRQVYGPGYYGPRHSPVSQVYYQPDRRSFDQHDGRRDGRR